MDAENPFPPYKPAQYVKLKNGRRYIAYYVWNANTQKLQRMRDYSVERECKGLSERQPTEFAKGFISTLNEALRRGAHIAAGQTPGPKRAKALSLIDLLKEAATVKAENARPRTKYIYDKSIEHLSNFLAAQSAYKIGPNDVRPDLMYRFQDSLISSDQYSP